MTVVIRLFLERMYEIIILCGVFGRGHHSTLWKKDNETICVKTIMFTGVYSIIYQKDKLRFQLSTILTEQESLGNIV